MYVSLLFRFVTFCKDRENAECLVFIHFQSLALFKPLDKLPPRGQANRRRLASNTERSPTALVTHPPPPTFTPKMACTVCLSLPDPLLDQSKRENGVSTVSFPDTFSGRMRFFSACLFRLLNLVSVCEFLPLVCLLSGNTRLHETWRAV